MSKLRIFVDCDDTLVLWRETIHGDYPINGAVDRPNLPLIESLQRLNGLVDIYCWSGGGVDYATVWAEKYLNGYGVHYVGVPRKFDFPLREDDICVDDMAFSVPCRLMSPAAFIEWATAYRAEWDKSHPEADHGHGG